MQSLEEAAVSFVKVLRRHRKNNFHMQTSEMMTAFWRMESAALAYVLSQEGVTHAKRCKARTGYPCSCKGGRR